MSAVFSGYKMKDIEQMKSIKFKVKEV